MLSMKIKINIDELFPSLRALSARKQFKVEEQSGQVQVHFPGGTLLAEQHGFADYLLVKTSGVNGIILSGEKKAAGYLKTFHCLAGQFNHTVNFLDNSFRHTASTMRSYLYAFPEGFSEKYVQASAGQVYFLYIIIRLDAFLKLLGPQAENNAFSLVREQMVSASHSFFFHGGFSMDTANSINQLLQHQLSGLPASLYKFSKILEVIAATLHNYQIEKSGEANQKQSGGNSGLSPREVEEMKEARNLLVKDLVNAPTISELARLMGINENKLKKNFKLVFNITIYRYLRNTRLDKARQLIARQKEELNLEQIAEAVGYQSQSHFSRRFKQKYGVLPKSYAKSLKSGNGDVTS